MIIIGGWFFFCCRRFKGGTGAPQVSAGERSRGGRLRAEWLTRGDNEAASFTASDSVRVLFLPPVELLRRGLAGNVQPRRLLISAVSGSRTRLGRDRPFFLHKACTFSRTRSAKSSNVISLISFILILTRGGLVPVFDKLRDQKEKPAPRIINQ